MMNFKSDKLCVQPDPFCENKGAEENKEVLLSVRELCVKVRESENQKCYWTTFLFLFEEARF